MIINFRFCINLLCSCDLKTDSQHNIKSCFPESASLCILVEISKIMWHMLLRQVEPQVVLKVEPWFNLPHCTLKIVVVYFWTSILKKLHYFVYILYCILLKIPKIYKRKNKC